MAKSTPIKNKIEEVKQELAQDLKQEVKKLSAKNKTAKKNLAPNTLMLLITVIERRKAEFFIDLLQQFEVNMQLDVSAFGTAPPELQLVTADPEKQVIFTVIRKDMVPKALETLDEKFHKIRNGKGIAFTIPLTSTVGVAVYQFLSNRK